MKVGVQGMATDGMGDGEFRKLEFPLRTTTGPVLLCGDMYLNIQTVFLLCRQSFLIGCVEKVLFLCWRRKESTICHCRFSLSPFNAPQTHFYRLWTVIPVSTVVTIATVSIVSIVSIISVTSVATIVTIATVGCLIC